MSLPSPIVVTGPGGRLGRALLGALDARGTAAVPAGRPAYDLDDSSSARRLVASTRPALVVHAAAWTDVDGCAREPELAMRRNAAAVAELAEACVESGAGLVLLSTNEVFDGQRTDGRGYVEDDQARPLNPYGASKLAGEEAARATFERAGMSERLWIVRTAWLFGPPGNDFPAKITAAARRLRSGQPLRVVSDEYGSPTYTLDLARAVIELVLIAPGGTYHLAGDGIASRYDVAAQVVAHRLPSTTVVPITRAQYQRASTAPAWGVLDCSRARSYGVTLGRWQDMLSSYLADLRPAEDAA